LKARINRNRDNFEETLTQRNDSSLTVLQRAMALVARAGVYARSGKLDDDSSEGDTLCAQKPTRKQRIGVWMTRTSIQAIHGQFAEAEDTLDRRMPEADKRNLEWAIEGAQPIYAFALSEQNPNFAGIYLQPSVAISLRTGDSEREIFASDIDATSKRLEAVMASLPPLGADVIPLTLLSRRSFGLLMIECHTDEQCWSASTARQLAACCMTKASGLSFRPSATLPWTLQTTT
jgi:hypothetical protein